MDDCTISNEDASSPYLAFAADPQATDFIAS
jgi:hypothetical protein